MEADDLDLFGAIETLLVALSFHLQSKEEIVKVWVHLGEKLGVDEVFPHTQVVVSHDENGNPQPILLTSSPSKELVEYITGEGFLTDKVAAICHKEIKEIGH
jgi:hypothetical protein